MNGKRTTHLGPRIGGLLLASALVWACGEQGTEVMDTDTELPVSILEQLKAAQSGSGVEPILVAGNPSCSTLNADDTKFPSITSNYGFKIEGDYNRAVPMDGTASGTTLTGSAPADAVNTIAVTYASDLLDWSSTLGIDAVIMKGGPEGNVYVYIPESTSDTKLQTPINPSNGQPYGLSHVEFCYDYELTAEKTATAKYTRTYTWEITKSVDPASHTGFLGSEFTSSYDVFVDRTVTDSDWSVSGTITVSNPTPFTVTFSVEDVIETTESFTASVTCSTYELTPGASASCTYEKAITAPGDGTNTATVTSGNSNVQGATATAIFSFGEPTTTLGYPTINVTDYFDGDETGKALGSKSDDFTFEYDLDFACPSDPGEYTDGVYTRSYPNTAEIDETEASADGGVDLTCYALVVTKDADTEWFKKYDWTITKSATPLSHTGFPGDEFTSDYSISVDQTITKYGYRAFGSIYVTNPSGEVVKVDVSDAVDGTAAIVDCGDGPKDATLDVPAGAGTNGTDPATCSYTVTLDGTTQRVNTATVTVTQYGDETFTAPGQPSFTATADVIFGDPTEVGYPSIKVTDYPDWTYQSAMGKASDDWTWIYEHAFVCPSNLEMYDENGTYTKTFKNYAEIDQTGSKTPYVEVDLTCYIPAKAKVVKNTTEGSEDIGKFPLTFELYNPSGAKVETQTLGTGGGEVTFTTALKAAGTWTLKEVLPAGWVATKASSTNGTVVDIQTCTFDIAFPASADVTYDCTFDNVEKSRTRVVKTSNGLIAPQYDWKFALFDGPNFAKGSGFLSDPLKTSSTLNDGDGVLTFDDLDLNPFATYTVCEMGTLASAGWTSEWTVGGVIRNPYNPHATDPEPQSLGYHCLDFGYSTAFALVPGEFLQFYVNNSKPGGAARTPGYWKNWSSCSDGGQYDKATGANDPDNDFWALDELLSQPGFTVGNLPLGAGDCDKAVNILDHRDVKTGRKMANDAAYDLARNLFAYYLNQAAGAYDSPEAEAAALEAQALLVRIKFNGAGSYLRPKNADYARALELSKILDKYNNNLL